MSPPIVRNSEGVLLNYGTFDQPLSQTPHFASDNDRIVLLKAENEVRVLATIGEYAGLSNIGIERVFDALIIIQRALELLRLRLATFHAK